jgi:exopolysaccharide production protein ExoY
MYRTDSLDHSTFSSPLENNVQPDTLPRASRGYAVLKRSLDILGAVSFFIVCLPMYVIIALGVKFSSPGPIHYWQYRVGKDGRKFRFYKFRSMVINSDEVLSSILDSSFEARTQWEQYQKLDNDPRVTRFGAFIRRTSLDELPQFWNVLRGQMSLVGPRPVTPAEQNRYGAAWAYYCAVRPGLTGLWQVSGRSDVSYAERVGLDVQYVQTRSFASDISILFRTVAVVVAMSGSR